MNQQCAPAMKIDATKAEPGQTQGMQIRVGFEMAYQCPQPTPMILALSVAFEAQWNGKPG